MTTESPTVRSLNVPLSDTEWNCLNLWLAANGLKKKSYLRKVICDDGIKTGWLAGAAQDNNGDMEFKSLSR